MKIKNSRTVFCLAILSIIPKYILNEINTQEPTQQESIWHDEHIEQYLETYRQETPSQFGTRSLGAFFEYRDTPQDNLEILHEEKINLLNAALGDYISEIYNHHDYAVYVSQNAEDLFLILSAIKQLDLGIDAPVFSYTILKLFHEKLKQAELVDDSMIIHVLRKLPDAIGYHFDTKQQPSAFEKLKDSIKQAILGTFSAHLPLAQTDPTLFSSLMSHDIVTALKDRLEEEFDKREEIIRLQNLVVRFLENIIGKAVWDQTNHESFIPLLNAMANGMLPLVKSGIIDHADDFDSLRWSLTSRASYFLELCGAAFPLDFYEEIEAQLEAGEIPFLEEEEQDEFIKTKKQIFYEAVLRAKMQSLAYWRAGIISQPMV